MIFEEKNRREKSGDEMKGKKGQDKRKRGKGREEETQPKAGV